MLNRLIRNFRQPPLDPAQVQAMLEHARHLLNGNEPEEAVAMMDTLLARQRDNAEAQYLKGTALVDLERPAEALPHLERAMQLKPSEARYEYNFALAQYHLGDKEKAARLCKTILAHGEFHPARVLIASIELPGEDYFKVLAKIHQHVRPETFVEIGVYRGWSLRLVHPDTLVLGVDPRPRLEQPPGPKQRIFAETSDDFFANHDVIAELGGRRIDMAFIDGMHHFEFALRDFINIERLARRDSIVLVHDCYPIDAISASRDCQTDFWSGDIWRLSLILKKYRPDLQIRTIGAAPTGLGLILNLDPESRVLSDNLDSIVQEFMTLEMDVLQDRKAETLNLFPNDWPAVQAVLDARPR